MRAVKVVPPQLPAKVVQRPRLLATLDESVQRPVTLVCAGPGSGKTVLVNSWARQCGRDVVWVSLDPADDREERFWTLVQDALQHHGLVAPAAAPDTGRSMVERAIDDLVDAAARSEDMLVLVLDDVHVLADADVIASLDALLRHPPPRLRVIMTALSDPVIPLHRYRIQGNLSEIRAAELAMSREEVEQLLTVHGIHLSPAQVTQLAERTEGWVAGLRLSAMRMEGTPDPEQFVAGFAMDRGSIGEYLMSEVLAHQPAAVQKLLIRSSICDPVTGDLADAICEGDSGSAILRDLAARNAFVMAVDHDGTRYRYHPLLGEVLRHLLHREPDDVQRRGHANAARWHDRDGNLVEALDHALQAQDWSYSADLLARGAFEELYLRAAVRPLSSIGRFIEIPGSSGDDDPEITAAQAAVAAALGRFDTAAHLLEAVEGRPLPGGAATLVAYARFLVARRAGDFTGSQSSCAWLSEHDGQGPFGTFALCEMGSIHLWQGSDVLADASLQQALKQATAQSLPAIALRCLGRLALLHCTAGRLSVAERVLHEGAELIDAHPWVPEEFRVAYNLGNAQLAMMHGDLDRYSRFLRRVDADLAPKADPALSCMTALIQTKALQSAGHVADAYDTLLNNKGRQLPGAWNLRTWADILLMELQAELGRAERSMKRLESIPEVNDWTTARRTLALARAHLAEGDVKGTSRLVRKLVAGRNTPALPILVEGLLLSAEAADVSGEEANAVEAATAAIQLAANERLVLPFIVASPRLRELVRRHPALSALWPAPMDNAAAPWGVELRADATPMPLVESLTEREVFILSWLTTTMTMAEIATELYVSTNTVKTHVAAIYRKLDASNRREAIARGRQLHLI